MARFLTALLLESILQSSLKTQNKLIQLAKYFSTAPVVASFVTLSPKPSERPHSPVSGELMGLYLRT